MFSTKSFVALLVFAAPFFVHADVTPTRPAPGDVYNEGSTCYIAWKGDTLSTTLWKSMDIELMTGNNTDMVSLASNYYFFFSISVLTRLIYSLLRGR